MQRDFFSSPMRVTLPISSPIHRFSIPKTYLVKVGGVPEEKKLTRLKRGVMLEDGKAKAVSFSLLRQREKNSWVRVVVTEGRNHLVKRMFSAIGHTVLKLKRSPIRTDSTRQSSHRSIPPSYPGGDRRALQAKRYRGSELRLRFGASPVKGR